MKNNTARKGLTGALGLLFSLATPLLLLTASCQQCMECRVVDQSTGQVAYTSEQCGTTNELNAYEEDCQATYQPNGYDCQCTYQ